MSSAATAAPATYAGPTFSGHARVNYLSTLRFDAEFLAAVQSSADGVEVLQLTAESADEIPAQVWAQVDVLHTYGAFPDAALAPKLRWIQLDTSGVDHVRRHGVWLGDVAITSIGGVSPVPLAEYTLWAILGVAHRLPALLDVHRSRQWPDPVDRWNRMLPAPVRGATVGIVGYGRIGREIGRLALAFGMKVIGVSRTAGGTTRSDQYQGLSNTPLSDARSGDSLQDSAMIVSPARLHEVLRLVDYLVVVVPLTDQTANMIDGAALAALKDGAVVINVARGGIVDEQALRANLRSGHIRAAVLDVFDAEPLSAADPWWDEPNVFVTPHVSGLAPHYREHVLDIVSQNLRRFCAGQPLLNVVDRVQGY